MDTEALNGLTEKINKLADNIGLLIQAQKESLKAQNESLKAQNELLKAQNELLIKQDNINQAIVTSNQNQAKLLALLTKKFFLEENEKVPSVDNDQSKNK